MVGEASKKSGHCIPKPFFYSVAGPEESTPERVPLERNQKQTTYVPLQTREHAWAGMSGMLRFGGARGAFYVPRR